MIARDGDIMHYYYQIKNHLENKFLKETFLVEINSQNVSIHWMIMILIKGKGRKGVL